jgi:pSer/pThr/pTyr-binding forkhead associated (FHA) protein
MVRQVRLIERGNTPEQTRELTITQPEYLIGRGPDCDLRLPATEVSRHHCIIRLMAGEASVIDLGSVNGTFLNGQRVRSQAVLQTGDQLQLGEFVFHVQLDDDQVPFELGTSAVDPLAVTQRMKGQARAEGGA